MHPGSRFKFSLLEFSCWSNSCVPKYHAMGVVSVAKGSTSVRLVRELRFICSIALDTTAKIVDAVKLVVDWVAGTEAIEKLRGG
jgi:hypothetical protein